LGPKGVCGCLFPPCASYLHWGVRTGLDKMGPAVPLVLRSLGSLRAGVCPPVEPIRALQTSGVREPLPAPPVSERPLHKKSPAGPGWGKGRAGDMGPGPLDF
jgi:hypothetical protein